MRTRTGMSPMVAAGNVWFTLLGFLGMYSILAILFLFLVYREIEHGPGPIDLEEMQALAAPAAD
jgi:cytochrome bd ubiquinol oxidase subunit I